MRKPKRADLVKIICEKIGLPPGKKTDGFFTREQLMELTLWVERQKDKELAGREDAKDQK